MVDEIDEDIKLLISELNRVGLTTCSSCQGTGHNKGNEAFIMLAPNKIKDLGIIIEDRMIRVSWTRELKKEEKDEKGIE
ncbi:MAG: hypothetical protein FVQ80_06810 [Planctomycetes bacterium]|nr:hypothetical protein [Planctomycetota bacterium]